MKHRVAEDGVEFRLIREFFTADHVSFKAKFSGRFNLRSTGVHGDYIAPEFGEFLGQHSVAATEIENSLARLRRKKLQNG